MDLEKLNSLGLDRILVFRKIYETKSIKLSAQALYLTPSAVSQTLSKLEEGIKTQLFIRSAKQLIPTAKAKCLFDSSRGFIQSMNDLLDDCNTDQVSGTVKVGAPAYFGLGVLLDALEPFRKAYPKIDICISITSTHRVIDDLASGKIDVGFIDEGPYLEDHQGIVYESLLKEELVLCGLSSIVPMVARKPNTKLADITRIPHISYHAGIEGLRKWYLHHFKKVPQLNVSISIDHPKGIAAMIQKGWGVGVVPRSIVEPEIRKGNIVIIPGPKSALLNGIAIAQLGARLPEAAQKKFVSEMKAYFVTSVSHSLSWPSVQRPKPAYLTSKAR